MTEEGNVDERPVVLRVDHVAKMFRLPTEQATGLKMAFLNWTKGIKGYTEQHVLRDINFEVRQGDFFGIVGRNGSGKSTLLKIISQIYTPEHGSVTVKGKLVPFIELGVGFNPELTGRENVYLNGALLGFTRAEIDAMYDDIVEFAELEDFMDQKLKNYSSGMQVRLAFSVAIKAQGDILVLDEVLAVGDEAFQRKCDNFFAEIEQAAFNPANVIEGIGFSPDKMLQGRLFSYGDAQRYRLGVNNNLIPVNKPRCPFHDYHRDGQMRTDGNYGATIPYQPNSYGEWQDSPNLKEPPLEVNGAIYNYDERELDSDYFTQPGKLWRLMSAEDQRATCENTARAMGDSALFIKQRHVRNCSYADPEYGKGVAKALGIDYEEALKAEDPAHPTWDPRNKK